MMENRQVIPTVSDRQVFSKLPFDKVSLYTSGNVDRRKYDRLENIGRVKGVVTNISDVEYQLTLAGRLELALIEEAAAMENDFPDPAPRGFQTQVNAGQRRTAGIKLKVGGRVRLGHDAFTVDAIEGDVVMARTSDGQTVALNVSPIVIGRA
jgi:N-acetylmuramoyl-L-alanine amidase